jgi:hypothetical protein
MQFGEKEQLTTAASRPPYMFVVWYLTKDITYLVPFIYVTQNKIFLERGETEHH